MSTEEIKNKPGESQAPTSKSPGEEQVPGEDQASVWKGPAFVVAKGDPTKDSVINTISLFIDENKQYIQYGLYTLAAAGLIKIGYSVRAFTRFSSATKIPDQFYKDRVQVFVRVKSADIGSYKSENVPLLRVSHIPILQTPFNKHSESNINVLVPGLHIHPDFIEMSKNLLEKDHKGTKLKIRLLEKFNDCAVGEARTITRLTRSSLVGQQLVTQGFAELSGNCDAMSSSCVASLKKAENVARRKNRGLWQHSTSSSNSQPSGKLMSVFSRAKNFFSNFFTR